MKFKVFLILTKLKLIHICVPFYFSLKNTSSGTFCKSLNNCYATACIVILADKSLPQRKAFAVVCYKCLIDAEFSRIPDDRGFRGSSSLDAFGSGASSFRIPRDRERRPGHAEITWDKGFRAGRRKVLPREADQHRLLGLNHHRPCCCILRSSSTPHASKQILLLLLSESILELSPVLAAESVT